MELKHRSKLCHDLPDIEAAARAAAAVPLALSTYDARPRWCAVSLAHPIEFARFLDDARVKFYFNAGDDASTMQNDADFVTYIQAESRQKRETRLRQIFGAYVCGDALPWMEPFTDDAYTSVDANPVRDMTDAITACLASIVDGAITCVPAELREPDYVRLDREQADARPASRKRDFSD